MIAAGTLLGGYAAYFLVRAIVAAPGINLFIKVVILVGAAGLLITIVGLIMERRREKDDYSDDGDD
jgi:branched-subunit amino acid ABC-type transport system permease component